MGYFLESETERERVLNFCPTFFSPVIVSIFQAKFLSSRSFSLSTFVFSREEIEKNIRDADEDADAEKANKNADAEETLL